MATINILYFLLTLFGLGFLIFIHELGHYFMARKEGMRVETFSIGFGKPIFSWYRGKEHWKIGWILFGGYVKIAGETKEKNEDPYAISDGYFGKSPWARIRVAAMGPIVNIVFALLAFTLLWSLGGREKNFEEFSSYIGWVDPSSELYQQGVRPGDRIVSYDDHPFTGVKDHLYAAMIGDGNIDVKGYKVDYRNHKETPFDYNVKPYPNPNFQDRDILTLGVLAPAKFLYYNRLPDGSENPFPEGAPIANSGLEYGDRIVWVDGERVFSVHQFSKLVNDGRALLTVKRGEETFLARVPRLLLEEYKLSANYKEELEDWMHASNLKGELKKLFFIPYNLTWDGIVEGPFDFFDEEIMQDAFPELPFSKREESLKLGDRIIAVNGKPINKSYEILDLLQKNEVHIIVEREAEYPKGASWKEGDTFFSQSVNWDDINAIAATIGKEDAIENSGKAHLLKPITPIKSTDFPRSPLAKKNFEEAMQAQKEGINAIENPAKREEALEMWEKRQNQLFVGAPLMDLPVQHNPQPHQLFQTVFQDIWRTLHALFTGYLNPKWLAGPIGIVQIIHYGWSVGIKEGIFWLAVISLNLGILNLLPIPLLDGGSICFSLFEGITRKKIKPKTMERMVVPFMVLLIGFFIFVTYQDVLRLVSQLFL